jgi:hypothetical protein
MRRPETPLASDRTPRLSPQVKYDAVVAAYIHEISSRHESSDSSLPAASEE